MFALEVTGYFPKGLPMVGGAGPFFKKFAQACAQAFAGMVYGGGMDQPDKKTYVLMMQMHPASGPVTVRIQAPNQVTVFAPTGAVGPGYHQFVCDKFRALGQELKINWVQSTEADPTGYFFTPDRSRLEAVWLREYGRVMGDLLDDYNGPREDGLFYPPLPHQFEHDGAIATPLGPRPVDWLERVAQRPEMGKDVFAWWDAGTGANYHLGRGLAHLWNHARFRAPVDQEEGKYLSDMLNAFESAFRTAPQMMFPWREWQTFLGYTQRPASDPIVMEVTRRAQQEGDSRPLFGYRLRNARLPLANGWSLVVPGAMWDTMGEGATQYEGFDGKRTIQAGDMTPDSGPGASMSPEELLMSVPSLGPGGLGEDMEWKRDGIMSKANLHKAHEEGRSYWRLGTLTAVRGSIFTCTINFDDESDRDWAIGTWKSIEHQA